MKRIKKLYGYAIEISGNNQRVAMLAFAAEQDYIFDNIIDFKNLLLKNYKKYHNCIIGSYNLGFDFNVTFKGKEAADWHTCYSKTGSLLFAFSYIEDGKFTKYTKKASNQRCKITFVDTVNYAQMSLEKVGKIIGLEKLKWDFSLDWIKLSNDEFVQKQKEYETYCMRDAHIAKKFLQYLEDVFFSLGSSIQLTMAATAEKIFRNIYLKGCYRPQSIEDMDFIYESYYGGRTETFVRGLVKKKMKYYDFNSLYPSVMHDNEFPDPNYARNISKGSIFHINNFHGVSEVDIDVPYMHKPPLPWRSEKGKVLFPYGFLHGIWTHIEIRRAVKEGCKIINVGRTLYYTKTCTPFYDIIHDLYNLRLKYKKEKNPMEYGVKITANSFYGKLGQRYDNKSTFMHNTDPLLLDFMEKYTFVEKGDYFEFSVPSKPKIFCFPIWASYVTAYGRIKLYDAILEQNSYMCDTDSSVTEMDMPSKTGLGELKVEHEIDEMIFIRPKFYGMDLSHEIAECKTEDAVKKIKACEVKCKGMNNNELNLGYHSFKKLISDEKQFKVHQKRFTKFRTALRGKHLVNSVFEFEKTFSLDDTKREWVGNFDINKVQQSKPIKIIGGIPENEIKKKRIRFFKG